MSKRTVILRNNTNRHKSFFIAKEYVRYSIYCIHTLHAGLRIPIHIVLGSWIRISIKVESWIRIRIKVKSRIRIRIRNKVKRVEALESHFGALKGPNLGKVSERIRIRICIKLKVRIRIRVKVGTGSGSALRSKAGSGYASK